MEYLKYCFYVTWGRDVSGHLAPSIMLIPNTELQPAEFWVDEDC